MENSERQASPEEQESAEVRLRKLEGRLAEKDRALAEAGATISELKKTQVGLESQITEIRQKSAALEEGLTVAGSSLKSAVESYRTLLIRSNAGVPAELVGGDSIEAVNDSLEKAKALVSRVKQGLETELLANRVPVGAPARSSPNLSSLSPREKISYAMGRNT